MLAGKLRRLLPVRNYFLFPLPVENLAKLRRPAKSGPVGHGVGRAATRASGKTHDHFDVEFFGEEHGSAKGLGVALSQLGVRMKRVTMTTESCHMNIAVCESILPRAQLAGVVQ